MRDQVRPEAEKQIKKSLVVEAVAEKEAFEVTEEDKEAEIESMAKQYQMEVDKIKEIMGEEQMEALEAATVRYQSTGLESSGLS